MDCRTTRIYSDAEVAQMTGDETKYLKRMMLDPTPIQRRTGKVGRNDPCPCGSHQKFKRCCMIRSFTPQA